MPSRVASSAYSDMADAMSNASVHRLSSRARMRGEENEFLADGWHPIRGLCFCFRVDRLGLLNGGGVSLVCSANGNLSSLFHLDLGRNPRLPYAIFTPIMMGVILPIMSYWCSRLGRLAEEGSCVCDDWVP